MGGYGSGHKLDFTGDPAIVCAQRARKKRREQKYNDVQDDCNEYMPNKYEKRIESLEKDLKEAREEYDKTLNELIEANSKLYEVEQSNKIFISIDLDSKESIDRAKRIVNSIEPYNSKQ